MYIVITCAIILHTMSPLRIEVYNPERNSWIQAGEVKPGDPPGSISSNKPDGSRDVYMFDCAPDDSKSTIQRSGFGVDAELAEGRLRAVVPDPSRLEVVKELKPGESYEMTIKTDRSPQPRQIRFTHK